jgi:predicted GTPase
MILMPFQNQMSGQRNVVIIGQSGVGKSSLINMLCPRANAPTSNDATGCTRIEREYECYLGQQQSCQVHDTIGLEEGFWGFLWAPKAEKRLKTYLRTTEVHLLVYCMPGRRGCLKKSHGRNYKKLKSAAGNNVRVVVVVTGLEDFNYPLESWWSRNDKELQNLGIPRTAGHACITALPKAELQSEKRVLYDKSCEDVKTLIRKYLPRNI